MNGVFAFACRLRGCDNETIYNARSANKAKHEFHRDILDPWPNVKYINIRVRKLGEAHTSEQFARNAVYRGMPDAKCGKLVRVGRNTGVIVGHNSSANFDVLFDDDSEYGAQVLNVHPSEVVILTPNAVMSGAVEK